MNLTLSSFFPTHTHTHVAHHLCLNSLEITSGSLCKIVNTQQSANRNKKNVWIRYTCRHTHTHTHAHACKKHKNNTHSRRKLSSFNFTFNGTFNVFWFRVWGTSTAWCPVEAVQHFKLSLAANLLPFTLLKWWHPQLNVSLFEDMWLWWIKTIKFQS